jgi:hypothetical protein
VRKSCTAGDNGSRCTMPHISRQRAADGRREAIDRARADEPPDRRGPRHHPWYRRQSRCAHPEQARRRESHAGRGPTSVIPALSPLRIRYRLQVETGLSLHSVW